MDPPGSVGEASSEGLLSSWGLKRRDGRLFMGGQDLTALASAHGTPLHVVSAATQRARCAELSAAFTGYPRPAQIRFSYKNNPVPGILRVIHAAGFGAEVVDGHELWLAERLGVAPADVVFNGPFKTDDELRAAQPDAGGDPHRLDRARRHAPDRDGRRDVAVPAGERFGVPSRSGARAMASRRARGRVTGGGLVPFVNARSLTAPNGVGRLAGGRS